MPISAEPLTWLGYTWAPKFSVLADRALQKVGFDRQRFSSVVFAEAVGQGLTPENEILLVWAGQQATDRQVTLEAVKWRRDRMGPEGWAILVRWFAAVYGTWTVARAAARASLRPSPSKGEEERV
jgi:hypothetical protein